MKVTAIVATCLTLSFADPLGARSVRSQETVYKPGNGVTTPVLVDEAKPRYVAAAMASRTQGEVRLEGTVRPDGTMTDIRVVKALHPDLDREATETFAKWRFKPGTKDGEPVAVRIEVLMTFRLGDRPSEPVYTPSADVSKPTFATEVKPTYPPEAREEGARGEVHLECVVRRDGTPTDIVVTKGAHSLLDQAAIDALKQSRFKPAMSKGEAVSVRIQLMMSFDLR
jgi:TonB family protein